MTSMVIYKMMAYVDVGLTLFTLIPMGIIAAGSIYFMDQFELRFANKQMAFGKMSDLVQESITGERVIKAFVQEENQDKAFEKVNIQNKKANMDVVKLMATFGPCLGFIVGLGYAIAIIYGGYLAITAQITLGRFVAFNREKCREHDVICFPRRLKTLKDPQRNKKHTAKDRIARKQKHDAKSNKQVREHRCAQPHFFPDNVTHFRHLAPVLKMFDPESHRLGKTAARNPILAAPP